MCRKVVGRTFKGALGDSQTALDPCSSSVRPSIGRRRTGREREAANCPLGARAASTVDAEENLLQEVLPFQSGH